LSDEKGYSTYPHRLTSNTFFHASSPLKDPPTGPIPALFNKTATYDPTNQSFGKITETTERECKKKKKCEREKR
jgi:hypothetical protein